MLAHARTRGHDGHMCVVALALHQHPDWPIIMIGNRDEFHARSTAPLHAWDDGSGVIAGRDLVGGGTWLGVVPAAQRLVVVTNARGERGPDPDKASRGVLVRDLLTGAGEFAAPDVGQLDAFNGFNLMAVAGANAQLMTNRPGAAIHALRPGVQALANEALDRDCVRSSRLSAAVQDWLTSDTKPETLLDHLGQTDAPALFLNNPVYGTRCSTLVAVAADGSGTMIERRFDPAGLPTGETQLFFRWGG
jgi:uncharacterized protein with NRDE domain